jgi:predicted GNAT superfamily acetyltransferase
MGDIDIRPLQDYQDLLRCEEIQREAWKMTSDRDIVPAHLLSPVIKHGGLVLGAFDHDRLVGFVFGFLGQIADERATWMGTSLIHCSEMMGVLPEYRSKSVGHRLKLEQRLYAINQGHRLMVWTFDPLLSLNAWLNIGKLGCMCRHYIRDAYGEMGGMYAGLPTDRFQVEWWLASEHVNARIGQQRKGLPLQAWINAGAELVNKGSVTGSIVKPSSSVAPFRADTLLVEIPGDFQSLKEHDLDIAKAWRMHTRALFEEAFAAGYTIAWFTSEHDEGVARSYYILNRNIPIEQIARETDL